MHTYGKLPPYTSLHFDFEALGAPPRLGTVGRGLLGLSLDPALDVSVMYDPRTSNNMDSQGPDTSEDPFP